MRKEGLGVLVEGIGSRGDGFCKGGMCFVRLREAYCCVCGVMGGVISVIADVLHKVM